MNGRGLTMIELLLSLTLLSIVCGAILTWTQVAAHAGAAAASEGAWLGAAGAVLQRIHDDLASGDLHAEQPANRRRQPPRVRVIDDRLEIDTRWPGIGAVTHEYRLDSISGDLALRQTGRSGEPVERLLLNDVARWTCEIDEEAATLSVYIASFEGIETNRRYEAP